jgi:hypothetical protein
LNDDDNDLFDFAPTRTSLFLMLAIVVVSIGWVILT